MMILSVAACEECRRRKVKCDKKKPCSVCRRYDISCITFQDNPRSRGRLGGRGGNKKSLQARLARLEALINNLDPNQQIRQLPTPEAEDAPHFQPTATPTADRLYFYVAGPIWTQLSEQIEGLRDMLLPSSEEEIESSVPVSSSVPCYSTSVARTGSDRDFRHPPLATRTKLLEIFIENVDQVYKIIHRPTMAKQILLIDQTEHKGVQGSAIHAVFFAIYAAAIMTLDQQQLDGMGVRRDTSLIYFQSATDHFLSQANFLNSKDLRCLQAFIIQLIIIRTQDAGQKHWVLLGLAVQLARGLGLHCQMTTNTFKPLQRELRLRLWQVLRNLDFRAALDRGVEPIIRADSYDTKRPSNLNDADLNDELIHLPQSQIGITDASFGAVPDRGIDLASKLQYMEKSPHDIGSDGTWARRLKMVHDFDESIYAEHLVYCDMDIPIQWMTSYCANALSWICQLLAVRPMSRLGKDKHLPPTMSSQEVLDRALQSLRAEELFYQTPMVKGFWWCTWNQWYILAVALVEICAAPILCFDEEKWAVIQQAYNRQGKTIADTTRGKLWKPMEKLMKQVRDHRESKFRPPDNLNDSCSLFSEQIDEKVVALPSCGSMISVDQLMTIDGEQLVSHTNPKVPSSFTATQNSMAYWDGFLQDLADFAPGNLSDHAIWNWNI